MLKNKEKSMAVDHLISVKAKEKSSDSQWLRSVVSSGTLKDKVAALTVQVQVSSSCLCFK